MSGFGWYFIGSIDAYNKNPKSAREVYAECASSMRKAISGLIIPNYSKAIGEAVFGLNKQILGSQKFMQEALMGLPKIKEQVDSAAKFAASAIAGAIRLPRITLPEIIFKGQLHVGKN